LARASYLASPPLVVAYALAGTVNIDFEKEPIGKGKDGKPVFLKDIWPSRDEVSKIVQQAVKPEYFKQVYDRISKGTDKWNALKISESKTYQWKSASTYIHEPPFFSGLSKTATKPKKIENAYVLASFGDSITTDHISPAGKIAKNSPAGRYLLSKSVQENDFNTYGSRRGSYD
jgi:aconitate hydratase